MYRRAYFLFLLALGAVGAACDDDETRPSGGSAADAGAADGAASSGDASTADASASIIPSVCEVAYSCLSESGGTRMSCVEQSVRPEGAKEACEGQSVGGLVYTYSEGRCPADDLLVGCVTREDEACQVAWYYGSMVGSGGGVAVFEQQCRAQGHEPVSP